MTELKRRWSYGIGKYLQQVVSPARNGVPMP